MQREPPALRYSLPQLQGSPLQVLVPRSLPRRAGRKGARMNLRYVLGLRKNEPLPPRTEDDERQLTLFSR